MGRRRAGGRAGWWEGPENKAPCLVFLKADPARRKTVSGESSRHSAHARTHTHTHTHNITQQGGPGGWGLASPASKSPCRSLRCKAGPGRVRSGQQTRITRILQQLLSPGACCWTAASKRPLRVRIGRTGRTRRGF